MPLFELLFLSSLLFLLYLVLFFPLGELMLRRLAPYLEAAERQLAAPAISALLWGGLAAVLFFLSLPFRPLLYLLIPVSLALWFKAGLHRNWSSDARRGLLIFFCYYLLALQFAAFPGNDLRGVSAASLQRITGFPIDNLIPYNGARLLTESIPFSAIEAVPDWWFTERGPLAAFLTGLLFKLLGVQESAGWLDTSPGLFFTFESLLVFLNGLFLYAVWMLGVRSGGTRSAAAAVLLLGTTAFFFFNVVFTWPKLFMGYCVLSALGVWLASGSEPRSGPLIGVLFGAALLAHEIALFYFVSFLVGATFLLLRSEGIDALRRIGALGAAAIIVVLPWQLVKFLQPYQGSRLLYLNLFCIRSESAEELSLLGSWQEYVATRSILDLLSIRLGNLSYPFDFIEAEPALRGNWLRPFSLLQTFASMGRYQLVYALGVPMLVLVFLFALRYAGAKREITQTLLLTLGALIPAAALFGCPKSTWNHTWAYPVLGAAAWAAGTTAARGGPRIRALFACTVLWNLMNFTIYFFYSTTAPLAVHVSAEFLTAHVLLAALVIALLLQSFSTAEPEARAAI